MLNRARSAPGGYQYTYASPKEVGPHMPMQLEFWIPKGRKGGRWLQIPDPVPGMYKTWRKVRPYHNYANKLAHSIARVKDITSNSKEARGDTCERYLAWARMRGLKAVTIYRGSERPLGFDVREVEISDILGPAPSPELCDN